MVYFEHWGVATLSTHLLAVMEKEVQEVQSVTRGEEVAQPASMGSITPQLGKQWLQGCTLTQLRPGSHGNPRGPALHLSSLSLEVTPQ